MTLYARPPIQNMRRVREEARAGVAGHASSFSFVEVREQRAVLVDHALRRARRPRRVDDHHAVVGR